MPWWGWLALGLLGGAALVIFVFVWVLTDGPAGL